MTKTKKIDLAGKAWDAVRLTAESHPDNLASPSVLAAERIELARGHKYQASVAEEHHAALCNLLDAASEMKKPIVDSGGRRAIKRIRERVSGAKDPRASKGPSLITEKMPDAKKGEKLCDFLSADPAAILEETGEGGKMATAAFRAGRYALRVVFKGGRLAFQGMGVDAHHIGDEPLVQFYDLHSPEDSYEMGCSYCGATMPLGAFMRVKFFLQLNEYMPHWRIEKAEIAEATNKLRGLLAKSGKLNKATLYWMKEVG